MAEAPQHLEDVDEALESEPTSDSEPTSTEENGASLFERNMAAMRNANPRIHELLKNHQPVSQLVTKDNGEHSIVFKDYDLYPEGAESFVQSQLAAYKAHCQRVRVSPIRSSSLDPHSATFKDRLDQRFTESGFRFTHEPFRDNAYFAVVMGFGLGAHVEAIVERTRCRVLAIVEPNLDFIYHSMSVFDWGALFEKMEDHGSIFFFTDSDPAFLLRGVKSIFRGRNPSSLDGTVIYQHYRSAIFREVGRQLNDEFRTAVLGLGFFQDEVNMIGQTYKNLEEGKARILCKVAQNPGVPAFIVASGPSLNALLPFLKENADQAVILCCGTALDILKDEGIEPDFWVMMERSKKVADHLEETAKSHDLSQLRFVGSTTIFPTVPKKFRESILFLRPGLSVAPLFARSQEQVAFIPDPMAANAALAFSLSAGFAEIYFIGVDCGSHSAGQAHAKGSLYDPEKGRKEDYIKKLGVPVKGNFGGTVWTTANLQWSRENMEKLIGVSRGHVFYNLGNGALIKGATPKHPRAVQVAPAPRPKTEIVDELVARYPIYTRHDFDTAWEDAAIIDRLPELCKKLKDAVRDAKHIEDFGYIYSSMQLLKPAAADNSMAMLLRGTLFSSIAVFEYALNRAVDPEETDAMMAIFAEEYCELVDRLCDRAIEIFLGLEDGMEWEDEFVE